MTDLTLNMGPIATRGPCRRPSLTLYSEDGPVTENATPLLYGAYFNPGHSVSGQLITIKNQSAVVAEAITTEVDGTWSFRLTNPLHDGDVLHAYGPGNTPVSQQTVTYDAPPPPDNPPYLASSTILLASGTNWRASSTAA